MRTKVLALLLALIAAAATMIVATPSHASEKYISMRVEDRTVNVGDEVFLNGEARGVPRGTKFLIQHREPGESWRTIGRSWLGVKVGHSYRVFTKPVETAGVHYYRVVIPANNSHKAVVSPVGKVRVS